MAWVAVGSAAVGAAGSYLSSKNAAKNQSSSTQQQLDPRIQSMLFGDNSNGLLSRYQGLLDKGPSAAANQYASDSGNYLSQYGGQDMNAARDAAYKAMGGNAAPSVQATGTGAGLNAYATGNMVQAPGQNNMDLSGSYDRFINGKPGENPFLDQSINGAIAQNRLGFQQLQSDATENLMENVMPSIRSNSVLAGQYGGSRQGIAEGNAIGQLGKEMARATSAFGQNATNAAVNAKAGAYETDSNRALSATQGLGAQQYGVASQNAQTKNQAEFMNVGNLFDLGKYNAGLQQNNNQFNAGLTQQGQLATNAQNNGSLLAGAGLLGGLTGQASSTVNASDNAELARAQGVNGLLAPYMSANQSSTNTQPLYQNTGANILGGAAAGLGLYNQFAGNMPQFPTGYSGPGITAAPTTSVPQTQVPFMSRI